MQPLFESIFFKYFTHQNLSKLLIYIIINLNFSIIINQNLLFYFFIIYFLC